MQYFEFLSIRIGQILFQLDFLGLIQGLLWDLLANFGDKVRTLPINDHDFKLILDELEMFLVHQFFVDQVLDDVTLKPAEVVYQLLSLTIFQVT